MENKRRTLNSEKVRTCLVETDAADSAAGDSNWELHDALFSVEHMLNRVVTYATERNMEQTLRAVELMKKYHKGQLRKGKEAVPYIFHPLMLACQAYALGIADDNLIASCLLHDVIEDCNVLPEELNVSPEVVEAVTLVSFSQPDGLSYEEAKAEYFKKINGNKLASMVKLLDRCNNVSTMAMGFSKKRIIEYIDETEKYIMPMLSDVKHKYPDYYNASFLIKYQMKSVIETLKRLL